MNSAIPAKHFAAVLVDPEMRVIVILLVLNDEFGDRLVGFGVVPFANPSPRTVTTALSFKWILAHVYHRPLQGHRTIQSRDSILGVGARLAPNPTAAGLIPSTPCEWPRLPAAVLASPPGPSEPR